MQSRWPLIILHSLLRDQEGVTIKHQQLQKKQHLLLLSRPHHHGEKVSLPHSHPQAGQSWPKKRKSQRPTNFHLCQCPRRCHELNHSKARNIHPQPRQSSHQQRAKEQDPPRRMPLQKILLPFFHPRHPVELRVARVPKRSKLCKNQPSKKATPPTTSPTHPIQEWPAWWA